MAKAIRPIETVIAAVDEWGVDNVAAVALGGSGISTSHGPTDRVFAIASITKIVSAIAVLVAVEEQSISLDDPAGPPGSTVRHLLCHAGGYAFDSPQVIAEPGTRRIYSNVGYEVLAAHLAEKTGIVFSEYMTEAVLAPLSMASSELRGSAAKDMFSSANDLASLAREMLSPTLLAQSTWSAATAPQFPDLIGVVPGWGRQEPCPWGYGPEIKGNKSPHWMGSDAPPETIGHFGGSGTFIWVDPTTRIACVVLTDRPFDEWAIEVWPDYSDSVRRALIG